MVTINVDVDFAGMSRERMKVVMPLLNSLKKAVVKGGKHVLGETDFKPPEAKKQALSIIQKMPEATVELRKGTLTGGFARLTHREAPSELGTLLRTAKFAENFRVQLVPDVPVAETHVTINGKPATAEQVAAMRIPVYVAFGDKDSQVLQLLEIAGADVLWKVMTLKDSPKTRDVGFTSGVFREFASVLAKYDLPSQVVVAGLGEE